MWEINYEAVDTKGLLLQVFNLSTDEPDQQVGLFGPVERTLNLLIGLELAQGIDGPQCGGNPTDQCELQDQADDTGNGTADGEEGHERQEDGEKQAHDRKRPVKGS